MAELMDHGLHDLAGVLNQVEDGEQDLPVGLTELLNYCGALAGGASHDVVWFLHGGRLSIEPVPTAAHLPQLDSGRPCRICHRQLPVLPLIINNFQTIACVD